MGHMSNPSKRHRRPGGIGLRPGFLAVVVLVVLLPAQVLAADSQSLVRSLLIPGSGQAHQGHYAKAAIFAGSFVFFGFGLFLTEVQYNTSVDKYDNSVALYQALGDANANGEVVSIVDLNATYADVNNAYNEAEDRLTWRNLFLTGFVITYSLNVIDVIMNRPHDPETARNFTIESDFDKVALVRTFRF